MSERSPRNKTLTETSSEDVEEMTINCVRYMIFKAGSGLPIKRTDLQQHITKNLESLNVVIERTKVILKDVYGYRLQECDAKQNYYSISNLLPPVDLDSDEDEPPPEDVKKVLILLILTHIFMSNGRASESKLFVVFFFSFFHICFAESLSDFLKPFNIKMDQEHSLFGGVKHFMNYLIKAKYLCTEIEEGTQQTIYLWGDKAEKEISKLEILRFVAKVCNLNIFVLFQ